MIDLGKFGAMTSVWTDPCLGWPELQVSSPSQLFEVFDEHERGRRLTGWSGRARVDWKLETTLDRFFKEVAPAESPDQWLVREQKLIERFRADAMQYADREQKAFLTSTRLAILALGQHCGLHTRLLDWTLSPWIAAWFTCHEKANDDGVIWWFDFERLESEVGEHWDEFGVPYSDRRSELASLSEQERRVLNCAERDLEPATFTAPGMGWISKLHCVFPSARMSAQQAFHTFYGKLGWTHNEAVDVLSLRSQGRGIPRGRIGIPAAVKREVLAYLHETRGIDASSLQYPGVDIIARKLSSS